MLPLRSPIRSPHPKPHPLSTSSTTADTMVLPRKEARGLELLCTYMSSTRTLATCTLFLLLRHSGLFFLQRPHPLPQGCGVFAFRLVSSGSVTSGTPASVLKKSDMFRNVRRPKFKRGLVQTPQLHPSLEFQTLHVLLASLGRIEELRSAVKFAALDPPPRPASGSASPKEPPLAVATGELPLTFHQ